MEFKGNGRYDHHVAAFAVVSMHERMKRKEDNLVLNKQYFQLLYTHTQC